ncbi:MAG: acetyl-CoA carboxylase biotin carboxyl carrier protein subunit [Chitinophagales bacterium]|nr:acetyl-CoA carboxylase biotin carboxyl carrier protein subunit [Chitinophagaceae bacterium]MCB9064233.1 acetyl-CoA carboxylase biotin carboxyl carrier protein subunit [Chitinophagales bacterium]
MLQITVNDNKSFEVERDGAQWSLDGNIVDFDIQLQPSNIISILYNNKSYTATVEKIDKKSKELTVNINGNSINISVQEQLDLLLEKMGMDLKSMQKAEPVKAPMPGMILKVLVEPGQKVTKGDGLLILEAMKMENVLKAGGDATVKSVNVKEKTAVEKGAVLIEME